MFESVPPRVDPSDVHALLQETYALDGRLTAISGERDLHFLVRGGAGRHVLRIVNSAEPAAVTRTQALALEHIVTADPGLQAPRPVRTRAGDLIGEMTGADGRRHAVRLVSFVPGRPLSDVRIDPRLRRSLGRVLGRVGRALRDFACDDAEYEPGWDVRRAPLLRPMIAEVADRKDRANVEAALDGLEEKVLPRLATLPSQTLHNDLNPFNVMTTGRRRPRITGIIDFGDIIRAPRVVDLAVAVAFQAGRGSDLFVPMAQVAQGFAEVETLSPAEWDLVPDLAAARLAIGVLIPEWRSRLYPRNRDYILKNHGAAAAGLSTFFSMGAQERIGRWRDLIAAATKQGPGGRRWS